ncbi:MAG: UvrD-helicase domain-containing protein, partial [Myxococcaceae bacterium]|nr:UvrD-helicase domain-containing protein [Myxococcaceae bacterium]
MTDASRDTPAASALNPSGSALLEGLNEQQREAVLAAEGPVLILAGAGSGKTRVITHRLAHLVLEKGVPSRAILAVTFTNKAAGEMKERAQALLRGHPLESWISTFHSLCVRILRREWQAAGLPRGFVIYDEDDQLAAVREALKALALSEKLHPPRRLLARISAAKNSGRDPAEASGESVGAALLARLAERYQAILDGAGALDFDDLLLRTVALFDRQPGVQEAWRQRFRYLLVDEYQDTNRAQYELVRHLAGTQGNVTVVGDEDQSIYSWRGADIRNILDFERDFPGARVLRLEENYRSTQAILDAASGVVAHNRQRKGKTLRATRKGGAPVHLHRAGDEYQEAAWVVTRLAASDGKRAAVLYRMNAQSRLFEEALLRHGLSYTVVGGVGFYERREVKDALAYLRLVVNPGDAMALRRVLNVPARGIGARTVELLEETAARHGGSFWEAMTAAETENVLPGRAALALRRFRELIDSLRLDAPGLDVEALLSRILERSGYAAALAADESHESQDRLENLAELLSAASEFDATDDEGAGPAGFLDRVSLLSELDVPKGRAPIVLMTLHSAKGLEFEWIFLAGMEEGLLPHSRSLQSAEGLEEERRLLYVGMTRAREA